MRAGWHFLVMVFVALGSAAQTQEIIPLTQIGGLHAAYVVPTDTYHRVDVQLIVLSGAYDDPNPSGTAHLTEHLAAFSADATVLRQARERDIHATTYNVSTVYTNSGPPTELEKLLRLSRAVLDPPNLPDGFADSEIDIVHREALLGERTSPRRWLHRAVLQNLYGTLRGRAGNPVEDLPNLNLEAAYKFHSEHYVPSNVTLIVSGKIDADTVAELVSQTFGDTQPSAVPPKPWLDHKPKPDLRSVETIESSALPRDTLVYAKFVDFADQQTSIDMQGTFFIAVDILNARLQKALYFGDLRFLSNNIDWYFAKNADLELTIDVQLLADKLANAAAEYGALAPAQIYKGTSWNGAPNRNVYDGAINRSDHAAFHQQGYGAVLASEDFFANYASEPSADPNPNYHRQSDQVIDLDYARDITCAVGRMVTLMAF